MNIMFLFFNILLLNSFSQFIGAENVVKTSGFTKLDATGKVLPDDATNHACVIDHANNLMWEVKTDDNGFRDKDWLFSWYNSHSTDGNFGTANGGTCYTPGHCDTEKFVQDVNAINLCGFHDWRLPTTDELLSIVTNDKEVPLIDTSLFPNTVAKSFWTSSFEASFPSYALIGCFNSGYIFYGYRSDSYPVRLVRTNK